MSRVERLPSAWAHSGHAARVRQFINAPDVGDGGLRSTGLGHQIERTVVVADRGERLVHVAMAVRVSRRANC